jgi:predicted O-linked N-acetylglucosamine transferase (SPINDLY family)
MATISATLTLALEHHRAGRLAAAEQIYRQILQIEPNHADAWQFLGVIATQAGQYARAIECIGRAIVINPHSAPYHHNLGYALQEQGRLDEAAACYRRALELNPDSPESYNNLGNVLTFRGQATEAIACYQRALQLRPDFAQAHSNLGTAWKDLGELDQAVTCFRRALELNPHDAEAHSNLLYTLIFCPGGDPRDLDEEHGRWNRQHAEPLRRLARPHDNDRTADRRLRIGYLSPDFRWHPVGRFLLPLLESHDRKCFEIFCYQSWRHSDWITAGCRARADVWREVFGQDDERIAQTVRQDRIDILVDLTMHMAKNHLLVFAQKPAPVQVTYLAYCGTTGLGAMDYRLTDPYLDPPGEDERLYCEQSVRLPETYWCYRPEQEVPPVSSLPALEAGHVTFGCFNNFCKVSEAALAAWSRVCKTLPEARLLLHSPAGSHRDRVRDFLARQGVAPERLEFVGYSPPTEYFRIYARIDVAWDPFPYGGGTTTCDALWMGVPVVSLAGTTAVGRGGLSILSNVGLPELVARDVGQYQRIAVELARDLPRLGELRRTLRARMRNSPLMDGPRFARHVEAAYRRMWQRWCAGQGPAEP